MGRFLVRVTKTTCTLWLFKAITFAIISFKFTYIFCIFIDNSNITVVVLYLAFKFI